MPKSPGKKSVGVPAVAKKSSPDAGAPKRRRLVLLDAHAIIHRAYHALPEFTGPEGQPTGALYGLSSMLLRIIDDLKPDAVAACYDLPKPTVRHEAYDGYKATRTKTDDALAEQLGTSRQVFAAFGIPIYEREGFEADDILGTIAHELKDEPVDIVIASGDMDTLQLVDGTRVTVYTLKKGLNDTILYDEAAVRERFGFDPALVPDFKGLRGDPSDNIIGVPGIGEKTASDLILGFGSIESLYEALEAGDTALLAKGIKPRIIGLLREHEEDARFSKMLATIRIDAPIAFRMPEARPDFRAVLASVVELFDRLGFRSLRSRARTVLGGEELRALTDNEHPDPEATPEAVDPDRLAEAQVMLWLLTSDMTNPSLEDMLGYTRARTFADAYRTLETKLRSTGDLERVYDDIEQPLIPVLRRMEARGVQVDTEVISGLAATYRAELAALEARIYELAGHPFTINSPKQLGDVLFDELGLKPAVSPGSRATIKKTATGQRSTKETELEKLKDAHPIVSAVLEYRQVGKLLSTYVETLPTLLDADRRLHAHFLQTGTVTGRMASANPNLQNIPIRSERGRALRAAFVAPAGFSLLALDYSQIELRLAAILSGDPKLVAIFQSGRDVHEEVAAAVFGVPAASVDREMRRRAKIINFGILYGMGVNALKAQLGTSTAEAQQFYDDYFSTFSTLAEYLERTKGAARRQGFTETLFGRRREFPGIRSPLPYVKAQAERMAINAPIQGTQADVIKLAMVRIDRWIEERGLRDEVHLILQVHDELVFEVRTNRLAELAASIKEIMETALTEEQAAGVPILAQPKAGPHWGDLHAL